MLEICGEAADGPIWDPPSVVYWTTKASGRYPDREGTTMLLELWDLRRRLGDTGGRPSRKLQRSHFLGDDRFVKYRRSHPLIDVEHALAWKMPNDLGVVDARIALERMRRMIFEPKAFDWTTAGIALLPNWAVVAPVVTKRVGQDTRTLTAQRWIDMLIVRTQGATDKLLDSIRDKPRVIRELHRMPLSPWLRQGLIEVDEDASGVVHRRTAAPAMAADGVGAR